MAARALSQDEQKRLFATELQKHGDAYKAAFFVFPDNEDTALAIQAAVNWPSDPVVKSFRHTNQPKGSPLLPTKEEAALDIWRTAQATNDKEIYAKLMRLYGEFMGQIEAANKANATTNINIDNRKVIMMPAPQSVADWSRETAKEQEALLLEGKRMNAELDDPTKATA